jgi:diguanylate cyclase (GGDEF)-like protein
MDEINKQQFDQLLQSAPGGIAKLAFDDLLTILYATDTFYSLIKNVSDKIIAKAPLALLRIVYSADMIYVTQQLAAQKNRKDNMININFRTLQQDGSFKWVMITGNKTEETYASGSKTVPVYSCIAMDITYLMVKYRKLEQTNDYHRAINELSRDLYFEYEIATDTLSFQELFREVFGKDSVMPGFRKRLEKTNVIHPDERPAVVAIFNSVMSGRKQARFELRLITKDGTPAWYICYASIIFDENRNPYKVVGKLSTTNPVTKEIEKLQHIPRLDAMTGVCTKESAEIMISEAAAKQDENALSALMLVEIRNYKNLNEIRRTVSGENVLTTIGSLLKQRFRTSDVIGRCGLSEFVIYMKDLQSDQTVYEAAEQVCKSIETIYSYEHTKASISASIGIALQLGEADYQKMMTNANTALIMAKKTPTSTFEVFSGAIN